MTERPSTRALWLAGLYFAAVFAAGTVLGVLRELWLSSLLGARSAELLELALMAVIILGVARQLFPRAANLNTGLRLRAGVAALALLLAAEVALVYGLRGITLSEYLATRDPVTGSVYALLLFYFAGLPALLSRRE